MEDTGISVEKLADIIFEGFSEEELKKYDESIFNETLSVKDRFLAYCSIYWKYAKYSEEETRKRVKKILEKDSFYKNGEFDFSIFNELMFDIKTVYLSGVTS